MASAAPAVWVISSDSRYGSPATQRWPSFLAPAQQARLERIRQADMLYQGKHRDYFLGEDRSQFNFPWVRLSTGRVNRMFVMLNALALISNKSADLLLGQEPLIRCKDEIQQSKIDDLKERTNLHTVLYAAAVEASYRAETFLEAVVFNGQVYLQQVPANEIFPVGPIRPDKQYGQYDRLQLANAGTEDRPVWLLLITHLLEGLITRECWQLGTQDNGGPGEKLQQLDLSQWLPSPGLPQSQPTGTRANTITWIPNFLLNEQPLSDYDGIIDQQDKLNAKETQLARVLAKHADPKLFVLEDAADENGNVRGGQDLFFGRTKDEMPAYITWDAQLDAAMRDRDTALNNLMVTSETSPVLLGLKQGAAPDAYKKVRLEAFNSLTKAQRKALFWRAGIRRAINTCLDLEGALPGNRFDRSPISVELRDGIPIDDGEQATTLSTLKLANLISTDAAVEARYPGEPAAAALELQRIRDEQAASAPSVFLNESHAEPSPSPVQGGGAGDVGSQGGNL